MHPGGSAQGADQGVGVEFQEYASNADIMHIIGIKARKRWQSPMNC